MLVLSRKPGEQILVPQYGLVVTVVAVEGTTVRLGIAAPPDVAVYRDEVWRRACERPDNEEAFHDRQREGRP
jgi:carbon storage regulator